MYVHIKESDVSLRKENRLERKANGLRSSGSPISCILWQSTSAVLDDLFGVCLCEDDNWVQLGIVQLVYRIGCHVKQCMGATIHDVTDGREADNARLAGLGNTSITQVLL